MATAVNTSPDPAASSVTSPDVTLLLSKAQELTPPVEMQGTGSTTGPSSKKGLITTQAPVLVPKGEKGEGDYVDKLVKYMTAIMLALMELVGNKAKMSDLQNHLGTSFVKLSTQNLKRAEENFKEYLDAIHEAEKASGISKIVGNVAGGLMIAIGIATGDPLLVAMGAAMIAMANTDGQQKLDGLMAQLPGADDPLIKALWIIAIVVVITIATMGAGSGSATQAGANNAARSGAQAGAEAGSGAGAAGAAGSAGAANAGAGAANAGAAGTGASSGTAGASRGWQFMKIFGTASTFINPFVPLIQGSLERAGVDKEKARFWAELIGMVLAIAMAGVGAAKSSGGGLFSKLSAKAEAKFTSLLGEKGYYFLKSILQIPTLAMMGTQGGMQIYAGKATLDQAEAMKKMGQSQANTTLYQKLMELVQEISTQNNKSFKSVLDHFTEINKGWLKEVEPYQMQVRAVEVQG